MPVIRRRYELTEYIERSEDSQIVAIYAQDRMGSGKYDAT